MKYILLFMSFAQGAGGLSAEFDSLEACENALHEIRKEITYYNRGVCVPKSISISKAHTQK